MSTRIIDGATRLLGIVGDPVAQVRSPVAWCGLFRRNGMNAVCIPMHVKPADLERYFEGLRTMRNMMGLIVTIPHKPATARYVDELTERARLAGSANLVRMHEDGRWVGDIHDGVGFVRALEAAGKQVAGRRALVVGTGGVGTAIAFAIAMAGASSVDVFDPLAERANDLSRRINDYGVRSAVAAARGAGYDLVVNASPLGMHAGDPLPIDLAGVTANAIVGDVVNVNYMTPILLAAQALGCHVQRGVEMMEHQIAVTAEFLGLTSGDWSAATVRQILAEADAP